MEYSICTINYEPGKKSCGTYIQWDIIWPLKKNKILPFAIAWMDLGSIMLSEISQTEKDKYHMIQLLSRI